MAGRLGVLRRLVGVDGDGASAWCVVVCWSVLAVEVRDAKAESLRTSSAVSNVLFTAGEALGAGDVLGRRTLLSHPRGEGAFDDGLAGWEPDDDASSCCPWAASSTDTRPSGAALAASSLMAEGSRTSHEACSEMTLGW